MFVNSVITIRKQPVHSTFAALLAGAASIAGTGNAGSTIGGTGALLAGAASLAGAGISRSTGTGALLSGASDVVGTGALNVLGTGALVVDAAALAGVGNAGTTVSGDGALAAQAATVAGSGVSSSTGASALAAQAATVAGSGVSSSTGTGALAAQAAAVAGAGTVALATSYANAGGTGDRTALITVGTATTPFSSSVPSNLVNGSFATSTSGSTGFTTSSGNGFSFDFRPTGFMQVVDEIKFYQSDTSSHGTWRIEGWNGTSWTTVKSSFTLGGVATQTISFSNSTAYMIYRLLQESGTALTAPWLEEVEFKLAQGSAAPASVSTSYANTGGTGARSGVITISTTAGTAGGGGAVGNLINGSTASGSTNSWSWAPSQTGKEIKFDFASAKTIDEFKWYQDVAGLNGWWTFAGSNDDSTYTDLGGYFNLGGSGATTYATAANNNQVAYRYYKLVQKGGATNSSPWLEEIEFKIST